MFRDRMKKKNKVPKCGQHKIKIKGGNFYRKNEEVSE